MPRLLALALILVSPLAAAKPTAASRMAHVETLRRAYVDRYHRSFPLTAYDPKSGVALVDQTQSADYASRTP